MEDVFKCLFPLGLINEPYKNNYEYMIDEFKKAEMLVTYYLYAQECGNFKKVKKTALKYFCKADEFMASRLKSQTPKPFFAGEYIKTAFNLNSLEWLCLLMGAMIRFDNKYSEMFCKINYEKNVSYTAVIKLYFFAEEIFGVDDFYNVLSSLMQKMSLLCFNKDYLSIDSRVFENIMGNADKKMSLPGTALYLPLKESAPLTVREDLASKTAEFMKDFLVGNTLYCHICAEPGSGKKTLMKRVCDILQRGVVYADLEKSPRDNENFLEYIMSICREAFFTKSFVCFDNFDSLFGNSSLLTSADEIIIKSALKFTGGVFVLSKYDRRVTDSLRDMRFINISLETLTNEQSFLLWSEELRNIPKDKSVDAHEMANKFTFVPMQIKNAVICAERERLWQKAPAVTGAMLCSAAYEQAVSNLADKATVIKKKYTWDELVMHGEQKEIIKRACNQIKYKHIVYDKWGMKNKILYGRGLSMLFTGPPGTGKTMAAQVVAHELGLEIYKVDISKVISKYIGESEKNLGEVFDSAKKSNVILLFDETDAIFGKRTEVKDSHDKNANLETSYLLQKMEEYNGITIMTTNFLENIDKAFFRRISYVVHFAFPDASARKEIWIKMYPKETPLAKDIDFDFLANRFELAGGSIKNAVLTSAFMAASESKKISMQHIIRALKCEIGKQGKMVSKSDFGEYGYLL